MPPPQPEASLTAIESLQKDDIRPYLGGSRGRAVAALLQGLHDGEGPLLLTGPAGVGKSVVLSAALDGLADEPIRVIRLSNPEAPAWNHRHLAAQIVGSPIEDANDVAVATAIAQLTTAADDEGQVILAVDDAQTLTDKALQLLLLIATPARGGRIPPRLILAGRNDFWDGESRSELRLITGLAERVTLEALSGNDARDYIAYRLRRLDGRGDDAIAPDAVVATLHYSGGLPDRIDRVLAAAAGRGLRRGNATLTREDVEAAIDSLEPAAKPPMVEPMPPQTLDSPRAPEPDAAVPPRAMATPMPVLDGDVAIKPRLRVVSPPLPSGRPEMVVPASLGTVSVQATGPAAGAPAKLRSLPPLVWQAGVKTEEPSKTPARDATNPAVAPSGIRSRRTQAASAVAAAVVVAAVGGFVLLRGKPGVWPATSTDSTSQSGLSPAPTPPASQSAAPEPSQPAVPGAEANNAADGGAKPPSQQQPREPSPSTITAPAGTTSAAADAGAPVDHPSAAASSTIAKDLVTPTPGQGATAPDARPLSLPEAATQPAPGTTANVETLPPSAADTATANAPAPTVATPGETSTSGEPHKLLTEKGDPVAPSPTAANSGTQPPQTEAALAESPPSVLRDGPPELVSLLLRRGDTMLQQGDVAAARLLYERAAAAGSGQGATSAGKTYDPNFLATIHAQGLKGDVARAIEWYRTASALFGDKEAVQRLKVLTAQTGR